MAGRYTVELSPEAAADLRTVKAFHRPAVLRALTELELQAELETKQRKPFTEPLEELPDATWEVRVGDYRALYCMRPGTEQPGQTVTVLRVIFKGRSTTQEALSKAKRR